MRNYLISILFIISLISCGPSNQNREPHSNQLKKDSPYYDQQYEIYELEGCEYIVVNFGQYKWGSHKGNCKNKIHQKINN